MSSSSARIPLSQPSQKIQPPVLRTGVMVGSIDVCATTALPVMRTRMTAPAKRPKTFRAVTIVRDSRNPEPARQPMALQKSRRGDSNPRPTTYEAVALPLSYSGGCRRVYPTGCWHQGGHARRPPWSEGLRIRHHARMGTELGNGAVGRVMVGTDRSQTASKAVGWAAAFAEAYGAELHLVQVVVPT